MELTPKWSIKSDGTQGGTHIACNGQPIYPSRFNLEWQAGERMILNLKVPVMAGDIDIELPPEKVELLLKVYHRGESAEEESSQLKKEVAKVIRQLGRVDN